MPSVFEPLSPCLKPLSIPKTAEPTNFFTPQFLEPRFIQQLYCTSPPLGPTVLQRFNSIFLEMSLNISSYLFMQKTYLHNINLAHLSSSSKPSEPLCPTLKTTKPPASKVPLQLMSFNVSALQSSSYLQIHAVPHLTWEGMRRKPGPTNNGRKKTKKINLLHSLALHLSISLSLYLSPLLSTTYLPTRSSH